MIQLDLFEKDELEEFLIELAKVRESNNKVRKSLFAKHGELAKNYVELHNRLEVLEKNICKAG